MKIDIPHAFTALALAFGCGVFASYAQAASIPLSGSASFSATGGVNLSPPGSSLLIPKLAGKSDAESLNASPLVFQLINLAFGASPNGDFTNLANQAFSFNTGNPPLPPNTLVPANPLTFILNLGPALGIYVPDVASVSFTSDSTFLNVNSNGLLYPGTLDGTQAGGCATGGNTCATTLSAINFSFTKAGSAVSMSGTLFSFGQAYVPEPASLSLFGIGLAGWQAGRRRA